MTTRRIKYGSPQKLFVNNKELFFCPVRAIILFVIFVKIKIKANGFVFYYSKNDGHEAYKILYFIISTEHSPVLTAVGSSSEESLLCRLSFIFQSGDFSDA